MQAGSLTEISASGTARLILKLCKGNGALEPKVQTARAYLGFINMKHLGVLLLSPGRDASPSQGYPLDVCRRYPFIHLGEERQSGVKT